MAWVEVGRSNSQCSECRGNADPNEAAHVHGGPGSGYQKGSDLGSTNGCGVAWTHRENLYIGCGEDLNWTDMSKPLTDWDPLRDLGLRTDEA
jgi:hypothetical protein